MERIKNVAVANVFKAYPPTIREKLLALRKLILDTAAATDGVGEIEETLKWGEPAYLTTKSKSGSTIRIDWKRSHPTQYAVYFHCKTNLVETFRTIFPDNFRFQGNRSIVFEEDDIVPLDSLAFCFAVALTYHSNKKALRRQEVT